MRRSIHIIPEHSDEQELSSIEYMTPDEAEGELVCFEIPGTMGKDVYRIESVDLEAKETLLVNVHNGDKYVADDSTLPPSYNSFSTPRIGFTYTVSWVEHMNGRGEWVEATPEIGRGRYPRFYAGHEQTRTVEKTYTYTPRGVREFDIKTYEGEPHIFVTGSVELDDIDGLDEAFDDITSDLPRHAELGNVYINSDWEVVYYRINSEYKQEDNPLTATAD